MIAETLNNVAVVEVLRGRLREGVNDFQQSVAILRDPGDVDYVAQGLDGLGGAQLLLGDVVHAIDNRSARGSSTRFRPDCMRIPTIVLQSPDNPVQLMV